MKITAIKRQIKNQSRYSIFVDGKYNFSLNESQLLESELSVGRELAKSDIDKFKKRSEEGKIYDKTLNWLSIRPRSEWEIKNYLRLKKQNEKTTEQIINKLQNLGYVNDKKFAELWVENRRLLKPISRRRLILELRAKRIANEIIDEILTPDENSELEALKELVQRKRKRYPDKIKFMQYLARQGFDYNLIKQVLD